MEQTGAVLSGRRFEVWSRISGRITELRTLLERLEPEGWERRTLAEGWPVALVACHIPLALRRQARWIELVLNGRQPHAFDWERSHALNALVARRFVRPGPAEVLQALSAAAERWQHLLERMREDELDLPSFRQGPHQRTAEWVAGTLTPRHIDEHLRSIRATIGL